MSPNREYQIRYLAYQIWERAGRPDGRQAEHWDQAIRELDAGQAGGAAPAEVASRVAAITAAKPASGRPAAAQAARSVGRR